MKNGNWVPMSKAAVTELPTDRPYTKLEALFSLQVDYDNNNEASVAGYSKIWQWSRSKVLKFMADIGVKIQYPADTGKLQNQKGLIKFASQKRQIQKQIKRQIRFADSRAFGDSKNRSKNRSKDTTKDPLNPKDYSSVAKEVLSHLNKKRKGRGYLPTANNLRPIISRLKEGFSKEDCFTVIENKSKDPHFIKKPVYMRTQTLFGSKFESYLYNPPEQEKESRFSM